MWDQIWDAAKNEQTREAITFLRENFIFVGSGLLAVAAFLARFFKRKKPANPDHISGENLEKLFNIQELAMISMGDKTNEQEAQIRELKRELELNEQQLQKALEILGEANILPENRLKTLQEIAQRFHYLEKELSTHHTDDAEAVALKGDLEIAVREGELDEADRLLDEVIELDEKAQDKKALSIAKNWAQKAELAKLRLRYRDAAGFYSCARKRVPTTHPDRKAHYGKLQADILYAQGLEFADTEALREAVNLYQSLIAETDRETNAETWARLQNNLGNALNHLGIRDNNEMHLQASIKAFRAALVVNTKESKPLLWAGTQNNLGIVLRDLGMRNDCRKTLEDARDAYREALSVYMPDNEPASWAMTQNNLGVALQNIAEKADDLDQLNEAIAAYKNALKLRTRETWPLQWAATQNNLGTALKSLSDMTDDTSKLEEAIAAYEQVLQERARKRVPLDWALTQNNLAFALKKLGQIKGSRSELANARAAFVLAKDGYGDVYGSKYAAFYDKAIAETDTLIAELEPAE